MAGDQKENCTHIQNKIMKLVTNYHLHGRRGLGKTQRRWRDQLQM